MRENFGAKPEWLTFDCDGTLIQWDEGLIAAVERILGKQNATVDPARFVALFDRHEHTLEQRKPHRSFRLVAADGVSLTEGRGRGALPTWSSPDFHVSAGQVRRNFPTRCVRSSRPSGHSSNGDGAAQLSGVTALFKLSAS
jgi:hypothetical protein